MGRWKGEKGRFPRGTIGPMGCAKLNWFLELKLCCKSIYIYLWLDTVHQLDYRPANMERPQSFTNNCESNLGASHYHHGEWTLLVRVNPGTERYERPISSSRETLSRNYFNESIFGIILWHPPRIRRFSAALSQFTYSLECNIDLCPACSR